MIYRTLAILCGLLLIPLALATDDSLNLTELDDDCSKLYECRPHDNNYWFDCHYDQQLGDCRCYLGDPSQCNLSGSYVASVPTESVDVSPHADRVTSFSVAKKYGIMAAQSAFLSSLRTKLFFGVVVAAFLTALYFRMRESTEKNIRMARHYHKLAERANEKRSEEKAAYYYELSDYHREKAREK